MLTAVLFQLLAPRWSNSLTSTLCESRIDTDQRAVDEVVGSRRKSGLSVRCVMYLPDESGLNV
jgi:hypothetical protein